MEFCRKCGSVMLPTENKRYLKCPVCGSRRQNSIHRMKFTEINSKVSIPVVEQRDATLLPKTTAHCPNCGYRKAWWWVQQTDEETLINFFKCVKCGHTWRAE